MNIIELTESKLTFPYKSKSPLEQLQITPVFVAVEHPQHPYHTSGKIESSLAFYDGFDETSTVLFETIGDSKFYEPVISSKKRVFIKLSSNSYPSGWKFMLKIDVIPLKSNFLNPSFYENSKSTPKPYKSEFEPNSQLPNQLMNMKNPKNNNHKLGFFVDYDPPFKHAASIEPSKIYNKEPLTNYIPESPKSLPQKMMDEPFDISHHENVNDFLSSHYQDRQKKHESDKNGKERRFNHSIFIPGLNLSG